MIFVTVFVFSRFLVVRPYFASIHRCLFCITEHFNFIHHLPIKTTAIPFRRPSGIRRRTARHWDCTSEWAMEFTGGSPISETVLQKEGIYRGAEMLFCSIAGCCGCGYDCGVDLSVCYVDSCCGCEKDFGLSETSWQYALRARSWFMYDLGTRTSFLTGVDGTKAMLWDVWTCSARWSR